METKEIYEGKIEGRLNEWRTKLHMYDAKLQGLKFKAEKLEKEGRRENLEKVNALEERIVSTRAKLDEIQHNYKKLKEASEEAWDDLKSGGHTAWEELKDGVEKAWDEIKYAFNDAATKLSKKNDRK